MILAIGINNPIVILIPFIITVISFYLFVYLPIKKIKASRKRKLQLMEEQNELLRQLVKNQDTRNAEP